MQERPITEDRQTIRLREKFMRAAIREAKKAYALGEVPIGCVIVRNGKVIAGPVTGDLRSASCMLPSNPVPCVPEP